MNKDKLESTKNIYKAFLNDMETSNISNSARRYVIELNLLQEILKQVKECNLLNETQDCENKIEFVKNKLQNDFKITIKK